MTMPHGWLDPNGEWIDPSELDSVEEVLARLRGYHSGGLQAFLCEAARCEQGLEPLVLPMEDQQLAEELLILPSDRVVVEGILLRVGVERARDVLRQVTTVWDIPKEVPLELLLYLQRRQGEVTWVLEEVRIGVTGLQVRIAIASLLPNEIPYQAFYPVPAPYLEDPLGLEPWWDIFTADPLELMDDLGTRYTIKRSEGGGEGPWRVIVDGQEQARMAQRYLFTFVPGLPVTARSLTIRGTINLVIEQPLTESPPWPTEKVSMAEFSYTIDLQGWWPGVIPPDEEEE